MPQSESSEKMRPKPKHKIAPTTNKNKVYKASIFSNILDWLGRLILDQTKKEVEPTELQSFARQHEISLKKVQLSKVKENAKRAIANLEQTKERLRSEFGQSASSFIAKSLDPKICHIHELVDKLAHSVHEEGDSFQNFLHHAVEYVHYYEELDEQKLKRRIIHDAHALILQAIDKDLDMLANYKKQALDALDCSNEERHAREELINRFTLPVLLEIRDIANATFQIDDLHAFFVWKTAIDDKRNSLVELGLLTIDTLTFEQKPIPALDEQQREQQGEQQGEKQELELEAPLQSDEQDTDQLTQRFVSLLESRMQDFFVLLQDTT